MNYSLENMHKEIFTKEQTELLPLVASFSKEFGLVGGTAIALHMGHRESIDFDLFSETLFDTSKVKRRIKSQVVKTDRILRDEEGQYTIIVHGVQMTFFYYPYPINFSERFEKGIRLPDLLTLAAMKAFALGRRAKWKDYVDLYFILKEYHSLGPIVEKSKEIFGSEFNEKIIREQLAYFEDINYTEQVVFRPGFEVDEKTVKDQLTEWSLS